MKALMVLLATSAFLFSANTASAQQLRTPVDREAYFCSLCKIQECECVGFQCVNCKKGGLAATPRRDASTTREVCTKAQGRLVGGSCRFR
jgi:hypothetical protein